MILDIYFKGTSNPRKALRIRADSEEVISRSARYLFDVKFSCICRSQCQLQSSFIVFVNLYARVLVSEAPDVDFKSFSFHNSMAKFVTH